jgi:hypothetical protein
MEHEDSLPHSQVPSSIQSTPPHSTSWRTILILSSHLRLGLPGCLFPSGFPTKTLYTPFISHIRAKCPAHLILLDLITRTIYGEQYRSWSSSLRNFLHFPVTSSLLIPNFILNTQFSNTVRSSLNMSYRVWGMTPLVFVDSSLSERLTASIFRCHIRVIFIFATHRTPYLATSFFFFFAMCNSLFKLYSCWNGWWPKYLLCRDLRVKAWGWSCSIYFLLSTWTRLLTQGWRDC